MIRVAWIGVKSDDDYVLDWFELDGSRIFGQTFKLINKSG